MPVYNRSATAEKAIQSVLNQSYSNFEFLIIDDCSTDNSVEIIKGFQDNRIRLFQLSENSGAAASRNYGIIQSKGKYISFLDSDDYYEKDFLKRTRLELESSKENVGFCWTGVRYFENQNKKEYCWSPDKKCTPYLTFLNSLHIGTNSGISVKKEVFNTCGYFREDLPAAEDTEFFLRITQNFGYTYIPDILINIHKDGSDRLSKNFKKIARAYNIFLPEHYDSIDRDNFLKSKYYYKMMWLNYHLEDRTTAREFYSRIPGFLSKGKLKAWVTRVIYEVFPLRRASLYHQKLSSI